MGMFMKAWDMLCYAVTGKQKDPEWLHNVSKSIPREDANKYLKILKIVDAELGCKCIVIVPRMNGHRYFSKLPQHMIEAAIIDTAIAFKKDTN